MTARSQHSTPGRANASHAGAEEQKAAGTRASSALGSAVIAVLRAAASEIERRTGEPIAFDGLVANPGALKQLLDLLTPPAALPLREATRRAIPDPGKSQSGHDGERADLELARALTSPDSGVACDAAAVVRQLIDADRRARRRARRNNATPASQRSTTRDSARLERVRDQRNQARAQLAVATDEAGGLRAEIEDLLGEVAALTARVEATEQRLQALRANATDIGWLADTLARALRRDLASLETADPRPNTTKNSGSTLLTGQTSTSRSVAAELTNAAERAGVPAPLPEQAARWLPELLLMLAAPPVPVPALSERTLTVEVLGGGTEVGGSCVLVTAGDTRLLIDAGSRPGGTDAATMAPQGIERALAQRLHAVVVTHAHNDHAGWVPVVVARQPDVPVIVTDATAALLATMWEDSAKVLSRRAWDSRNDQVVDGINSDAAMVPPFGRNDVRRALNQVQILDVSARHRVGQLHLELFPAGHIVGAVGVVVHAGNQRAIISGDVSRAGQLTVGGIALPDSARGADLLVLESTYAGAGRRLPRAAAVDALVRDVARTVAGGGTVLVPAFALGRAQEVALLLARHLPDVDVLVDGLARDVCEIYEHQSGPDGRRISIFGGQVRRVPRGQTRAAITRRRPGVVVATSGMLHGGPSVQWARAVLPDPRSRLMIVGYQDEESPGGRLVELARAGRGTVELPNSGGEFEPVPVAASVGTYGLGAHADADDLVTISAQVGAHDLMLVHGDLAGQRRFAERLRIRGQATQLGGVWTGS